MFDEKKLEAAMNKFLKDEKWREYFYNAPSGAKEVIAISFYRGHSPDAAMDEEVLALLNEAKAELDDEDIRYIAEKCPNAQVRSVYAEFSGGDWEAQRIRVSRGHS